MNDPHVVALIYRVEHRPTVSYDKAEPLEHDGPSFRIRVKGGRATFEMKELHATVEAAREAVEPSILAWELAAGLKHGPDEMRFVFEDAEIIDRNPPPASLRRMIRTRQTWFCALLLSATMASRRRRSAALTVMDIPLSMAQTRIRTAKRESQIGLFC